MCRVRKKVRNIVGKGGGGGYLINSVISAVSDLILTSFVEGGVVDDVGGSRYFALRRDSPQHAWHFVSEWGTLALWKPYLPRDLDPSPAARTSHSCCSRLVLRLPLQAHVLTTLAREAALSF